MNNENMSDVSEEETDPIGDKMMEPASKEKSETERMDTEQDLTDKKKDKEREVPPPPRVLYDSSKANKKPTTKKPKVMKINPLCSLYSKMLKKGRNLFKNVLQDLPLGPT